VLLKYEYGEVGRHPFILFNLVLTIDD